MTDKQTPPDWVLIEAAKRSNWLPGKTLAQMRGHLAISGAFSALCDMIERYEQPPVDRKVLCAREAAKEYGYDWGDVAENACRRAIELWEEGYGE
jgi:hypothetical protein